MDKEKISEIYKKILDSALLVQEKIANVPEFSEEKISILNGFMSDVYDVLKKYYMETKYSEMVKRHEQEITYLQSNCSHPRFSWVRRASILPSGFVSKYEIKLCVKCNKEFSRRRHCSSCGEIMLDGNWKEGDGTEGRPIGIFFCETCWNDGVMIMPTGEIKKRKEVV